MFYERSLHAENRSSLYEPFDANQIPQGGYDSIDRLTQYQRGNLASTGGDGGNGGGSIALSGSTPEYINLSGTFATRSYALDGLGNWKNTAFTPSTTGTLTPQTEIRQHNGLNEITRTYNAALTPTTVNPTYDMNGNLLSDGRFDYTWDALNRLVEVTLAADTTTVVAQYYYDPLNRRIRKSVNATSATTDCIYLGWRCMEDRNPFGGEGGTTDTLLIQYIWGQYLDELIQFVTYQPVTTVSGETSVTYDPGTYYPLQDLLYRTTATTDSGGSIVEAYDFDAYGNTLIFNAYGSGSNWWAPDAQQASSSLCQFLFTGQRFDAETGNMYYKRRPYSAILGRFLSRDPIGYAEGPNLLAYGGCRPNSQVDALGQSPFEYHHIVGEWYAAYTAYGPRSQGLCILLSHNFHVELENEMGRLWTAVRSGDMSRIAAYNSVIWTQLRMFPRILADSWRASAATGMSMFRWGGGARALLAQASYATTGEMALGATGVGTVIVGGATVGYLIHEHGELLAENADLELQKELDDIALKGGRQLGGIVASRLLNELATEMDCSKADKAKVDQIKKVYVDLTMTHAGVANMMANRLAHPPRTRDLLLASAHIEFSWLVKSLEVAGCRPRNSQENCPK